MAATALSVAVVLTIAGFAWVQASHRATVALTVILQAPHGGVFATATSCTLREEYGYMDDSGSLQVMAYEGEAQRFNPAWQYEELNTCAYRELLQLDNRERYFVTLGSERLGDLSVVDLQQGTARLVRTIVVTRDLSGTLVLGQRADSCRGTTSSWRCTWYTYGGFSLDLDRDSGTCSGTGGYADVQDGMNVTVFSSSGQVVGSGAVTETTYDLRSVKSKVIDCKLMWSIDDVPNDDAGYSVELGKRGKVYFDAADLLHTNWTLDTHLGD